MKGIRCEKIGATLNITFTFSFPLTDALCVLYIHTHNMYVRKSEMAMTTQKIEIENEKKRVKEHTKPTVESNECFGTLNRPSPRFFHATKTQAVKIETFDL